MEHIPARMDASNERVFQTVVSTGNFLYTSQYSKPYIQIFILSFNTSLSKHHYQWYPHCIWENWGKGRPNNSQVHSYKMQIQDPRLKHSDSIPFWTTAVMHEREVVTWTREQQWTWKVADRLEMHLCLWSSTRVENWKQC